MKTIVLFVDDETQLLDALKSALHKEPFEILTADSGFKGLEVLSRRRVDVVVSDEQMPGMSGSKFLGLVRQRYPHTIRIILTGQACLEAAIRAINEGEVYRFLTKPCNSVDLAITIRQALQMKDLALQSALLLSKARKQQKILDDLERENPGITEVKTDEVGAFLLEEKEIDMERLLAEIRTETRLTNKEYNPHPLRA